MNIVYFTHSLESCWNHGNAHFLRGVVSALMRQGHAVRVYEPLDGWSRANLVASEGPGALDAFRRAYPALASVTFSPDDDPASLCQGADLVIVHEWNDPALVAALGRLRRTASFTLLFHDTHHRAVSDPDALRAFDLREYDGVLAFGAVLAEIYRRQGWGRRVWVWHEAADTDLFHPPAQPPERHGLVWIGNWGDDERAAELEEFLLAPAEATGLTLDIHGVRYPDPALAMLRRYGARYHGWLANAAVPASFARHLATVHVPRRFYAQALPGIPTIRVFEALACGIPLVSAPWNDSENLFQPGRDFLAVANGQEMRTRLAALAQDPALRAELAQNGWNTIRARHTCAHRAAELLAIATRIRAPAEAA